MNKVKFKENELNLYTCNKGSLKSGVYVLAEDHEREVARLRNIEHYADICFQNMNTHGAMPSEGVAKAWNFMGSKIAEGKQDHPANRD